MKRIAQSRTLRFARVGLALIWAMAWGAAARPSLADEAQGQENEEKRSFLRVTHNDRDEPVALEAAIVRFEGQHPDGGRLEVELVAAVHVADAAYFQQLNERFESYDAVLYELVAPEGTRVPKGGPGAATHPVGMAQVGLTGMLELAFQLEQIDYTRPNFKHADLSPEEFAESMKAKGESLLSMMLRMMGQAIAAEAKQPAGKSDAQMLLALFSKDRPLRLKRILAGQLSEMGGGIAALEGPTGSTLVSERNKRAVEVLEREIKNGSRRVAIFYGAAHMPDMAERIEQLYQLRATDTTWLVAWEMDD